MNDNAPAGDEPMMTQAIAARIRRLGTDLGSGIRMLLARIAFAGLAAAGLAAPAAEAAETNLTVSFGDPVLSVHNGSLLGVPVAAGFNKANGIEVQWVGAQGATLSMQAALSGAVDVGIGGISSAFLVASNSPDARIIRVDAGNIWNISVPADSKITKIADLKGKKIGVQSLAAAGYLFARGIVASAGLNPDKDVSWTPVGVGAQAASAIGSGEVDAYGANYGVTEAFARQVKGGMKFLPSDFDALPNGFAVVVTAKQIANNRKALVAFLKSYDEGLIFGAANPRAGVALHWDAFPNQRPTGIPLDQAIGREAVAVERTWNLFAKPGPEGVLGMRNKEALESLQAAYLKYGITKKPIDLDKVFDLSLAREAAQQVNAAQIQKNAAALRR